jgi:adenine-specific DNA-methyltransferase
MPEIVFKGKEYVYNHHLSVPYRPLVVDAAKGVGPADLNSNLIIHGDNLHALKALLPRYAGQVDLVFIDPPYNTGNEGWCYSDGVNSPIMKEWLSTNPVDGEDMLRHDKWLCMMWPRLVLLRELMSDSGSIWITLDDNEVHRARMVLDELFGEKSHVGTLIWQKKYSTKSDTRFFSESHEYVLVYAKDIENVRIQGLERTEAQDAIYKNADNDSRGAWTSDNLLRTEARDYAIFPIQGPGGEEYFPPAGSSWRYNKEKIDELRTDGRLWFGVDGTARPRLKRFLNEVQQSVPAQTIWSYQDVNHSDGAKKNLAEIFGGKDAPFATPKPLELLDRVIHIATESDALILDSFAGSGTTAHAVLKANAKDNGNRKFILVEGEDYADRLTAERVRRAIGGYAWVGTQRETLLEEKINFTQFKKAADWLAKVEAIKAREGFAEGVGDLADQGSDVKKRFDKINTELKDGVLRVEGEKKISQRVEGLGGEFTYCTLGEPLDIEKLLSGEALPTFEALGAWLFHTATGGTLPPMPKKAPEFYLGEAADAHVWLVYAPDLAFLKSPEAALNLSRAQALAQWGAAKNEGQGDGKKHLVFAPVKYLSNKQLAEYRIDFCPLPFALLRGV